MDTEILIAETDPALNRLFCKTVQSMGLSYIGTLRISETLAFLDCKHPPKVAIVGLDYDQKQLPVLEFLKHPRFKNTRVIVTTGVVRTLEEFANYRVAEVYLKPISPRDLVNMLTN